MIDVLFIAFPIVIHESFSTLEGSSVGWHVIFFLESLRFSDIKRHQSRSIQEGIEVILDATIEIMLHFFRRALDRLNHDAILS